MFYFNKLTICGKDISELDIFNADHSEEAKEVLTDELAEEMQKTFSEKLIGKNLSIVKEQPTERNYIRLSASNLNVNEYSVEIKDGNILINGSYLSVKKAIERFYDEVLQYKNDDGCGVVLDISEKDSLKGSLDLKVPYTKQDMLDLMVKIYNDDDKVLSGSHTYSTTKRSTIFNGSGIRDTRDAIMKSAGKSPVILELDPGPYSEYIHEHFGRDTLHPYDLSKILSESLEFVSEGGIISVCLHMGNPLLNYQNRVWYSGTMENREKAISMLT